MIPNLYIGNGWKSPNIHFLMVVWGSRLLTHLVGLSVNSIRKECWLQSCLFSSIPWWSLLATLEKRVVEKSVAWNPSDFRNQLWKIKTPLEKNNGCLNNFGKKNDWKLITYSPIVYSNLVDVLRVWCTPTFQPVDPREVLALEECKKRASMQCRLVQAPDYHFMDNFIIPK